MITWIRYALVIVVAVTWSSMLAGCTRDTASTQNSPAEKDDDHDHDKHEHAEHMHHPLHYPKNLADAIDRILMLTGLSEISDSTKRKKAGEVSECEELIDLISWLPELAADSDVNEVTFNRVDGLWMNLEKKLEAAKSDESTTSIPSWLMDWVKSHKDAFEEAKLGYQASLPVVDEGDAGK